MSTEEEDGLKGAVAVIGRASGVASITRLTGSEVGLRVTLTNGVVLTVMRALVDRGKFDLWAPGPPNDPAPRLTSRKTMAEAIGWLESFARASELEVTSKRQGK